jgi:hypothetical protein
MKKERSRPKREAWTVSTACVSVSNKKEERSKDEWFVLIFIHTWQEMVHFSFQEREESRFPLLLLCRKEEEGKSETSFRDLVISHVETETSLPCQTISGFFRGGLALVVLSFFLDQYLLQTGGNPSCMSFLFPQTLSTHFIQKLAGTVVLTRPKTSVLCSITVWMMITDKFVSLQRNLDLEERRTLSERRLFSKTYLFSFEWQFGRHSVIAVQMYTGSVMKEKTNTIWGKAQSSYGHFRVHLGYPTHISALMIHSHGLLEYRHRYIRWAEGRKK